LPQWRRWCRDGRWHKRKGIARARLQSAEIRTAELHWNDCHGIGSKEIKRNRYRD